MTYRNILFVLALMICAAVAGQAQTMTPYFRHFNTEEGLPEDQVLLLAFGLSAALR